METTDEWVIDVQTDANHADNYDFNGQLIIVLQVHSM